MSNSLSSLSVERHVNEEISKLTEVQSVEIRRKYFNDNFLALGNIGSGSEGTVSKMIHMPTGAIYAVKRVRQEYCRHSRHPKSHHEVYILAMLSIAGKGPGQDTIVRVAQYFWYPCTPDYGRQSLVLEFCELGSLNNYVRNSTTLRNVGDKARWTTQHEGFYRNVYVQLLAGLAFLHYGYGTDAYDSDRHTPQGRMPVFHRDMKPDNVLVCPALPRTHPALVRIKLADFGGAGYAGMPEPPHLYCMTEGFTAPELFRQGKTARDAREASDVFAAGATMHYCIFGRSPYIKKNGRLIISCLDVSSQPSRGGVTLSSELDARINDALTNVKHRSDAITIYEKLTKNHDHIMHDYTEWYDAVEVVRLEKEHKENVLKEARTSERAIREEQGRERANRRRELEQKRTEVPCRAYQLLQKMILQEAAEHPLRVRCHHPFCEHAAIQHFHIRCVDPFCSENHVTGQHFHPLQPRPAHLAELKVLMHENLIKKHELREAQVKAQESIKAAQRGVRLQRILAYNHQLTHRPTPPTRQQGDGDFAAASPMSVD